MKNKIALLLLSSLLVCGCVSNSPANQQSKPVTASVMIGGWNFSTNLEGWRACDKVNAVSYNSDEIDLFTKTSNFGTWRGVAAGSGDDNGLYHNTNLLYYPAYPNAPKDNNAYYWGSAGVYGISVLNLSQDLNNSLMEHDIAVYGSPDKIPDDRKREYLTATLKSSIGGEVSQYAASFQSGGSDSKSITFQNHMAERYDAKGRSDANGNTFTIMAVLLDSDTVAIIRLYSSEDPMPDEVLFRGNLDDIVNSLTITKPGDRNDK